MVLTNTFMLFQPDPITKTLAEEGGHALRQISLADPILGILLVLLFSMVIGSIVAIYKLSKKINEQSKELYTEAKSDFELVLAFEKKMDTLIEKNEMTTEDIKAIRDAIHGVRSYLELIYKK